MNRQIGITYHRMVITKPVLRIIYMILIVAVFGFASKSCSWPENQKIGEVEGITNSGFFTGQPCGPPCLWGITPGSSTQGQILDVLQEKEINNECEQFDKSQESGGRGIICRGLVVFSIDENEVVEDLGFNPSEEITVAEVIRQYGEPNSVSVTASGTPEYPKTSMILFFDSIQTELVLPVQEGITYKVEAETPIENIGYSSDTTYKSSVLPYPDWVGYGEYRRYPQ